MSTKFEDFFSEIEEEAFAEGIKAEEQMLDLKSFYRNVRKELMSCMFCGSDNHSSFACPSKDDPDYKGDVCLVREFFKKENLKPVSQRKNIA